METTSVKSPGHNWGRAKAAAMQATAFGLPPEQTARQFWETQPEEVIARETAAQQKVLGRSRFGAVNYGNVFKPERMEAVNASPRSYGRIEEEENPTAGGRRRRRKHRSTKKNKSKHKKRTRTRRTHKRRH